MPDTALAAVMQACVPRFPACSAASTWETWGRGGRVREVHQGGERSPVSEERVIPLQEEGCHLLGDSPSTLYELLLRVGIAGAALQCACLGDQSGTAVAQFLNSVLDVGTNLQMDVERRGIF